MNVFSPSYACIKPFRSCLSSLPRVRTDLTILEPLEQTLLLSRNRLMIWRSSRMKWIHGWSRSRHWTGKIVIKTKYYLHNHWIDHIVFSEPLKGKLFNHIDSTYFLFCYLLAFTLQQSIGHFWKWFSKYSNCFMSL